MHTKQFSLCLTLAVLSFSTQAQQTMGYEKYGKTLNLGVGIGYYGYIGNSSPVLHADVEFDVAKNFTLAPSISYFSYHSNYYWGNNNNPYRYYNYRQTIVPIGIKGTYYFDNLLHANKKWDFYLAGSLGVAIIKSTWDDGYYGDRNLYRNAYRGSTPLYLDLHIGSEYHFNNKVGAFLDLSTGVSTLGLAIHL